MDRTCGEEHTTQKSKKLFLIGGENVRDRPAGASRALQRAATEERRHLLHALCAAANLKREREREEEAEEKEERMWRRECEGNRYERM